MAKVLMKFLFLLIVFMALNRYVYAQEECHLSPTEDPESATKVYIPINLEDVFAELKHMLPKKIIEEMKAGTEEDMIKFHFGLGTWIRNNWCLYKGSRLSKYFNKLGIKHPDDMSGVIFQTFWRHLNDKPLQIQKIVNHYSSEKP